VGSSLLGSLGGLAWQSGGWNCVVSLVGLLLAVAIMIALRLIRLQPIIS
jgi:YNFM family putative membrane transporter